MSEDKVINSVKITIDDHVLSVEEGTTILNAATKNGISIPNLCYDGRVELYGACGLCVVEAEGMPKLLRACSTKVRDGMIIHTHTERVDRARKTALELLISDHNGDCKAPCTKACPAGTDCQGYVGLIANGEYKEAVRLIKERIPMPSSIGRICPHPCEKDCRRQFVDEPIAIAALKGFASDIDMAGDSPYVPSVEPDTGKKVAIVGGGPGGLTAAYFLRRLGHDVTVYDAMPKMGGMLRYGIPEYRLPKAVLDKEIAQIEALGITFRNETRIGSNITLESMRQQYNAVVLAAGAWRSTRMRVPGEDTDGVWGGIDFLRTAALKEKICVGNTVAVVGGGNTAMDACRTAVRLGAKNVYVFYRRTEAEMPAEAEEIEDAKSEGVTFKFLSSPLEFKAENGRVRGVTLQKMQLGEPDASGRRRPEPIPGATEYFDIDTAVIAIGQHPDLTGFENVEATKKGTLSADTETFMTSLEGVFAVGDMTNKGASIAVEAIGEAQKAATVIDRYLNGEKVHYKKPFYVERTMPQSYYEQFKKAKRVKMPKRSFEEAKHDFKEVALGISEDAAQNEAMRCLECGCNDYFECKLIRYANEYHVNPARFEGEKHRREQTDTDAFITRDQNKCILCGLCVRICEEKMGKAVIGLINRGFDTIIQPEYALPLDKSSCSFCGQCEAVCPTGALRVKQPGKKSLTVEENHKESVCSFCQALCKTVLCYTGKTVIRALPSGEKGLLCKGGRFGIFSAAENKAIAANDDFSLFRERLTAHPEDTAVIAGPTATLEELYFAKTHFENVYICADENAAAYRGAKYLGIEPFSSYKGEKNILLLNCRKPEGLTDKAYAAAFAPLSVPGADMQIFTAPFTAESGTYLTAAGKTASAQAAFTSKLPTLLMALEKLFDEEFCTQEMILETLKEKYDGIKSAEENTAIDEETIVKETPYKENRYAPVIEDFCIRF